MRISVLHEDGIFKEYDCEFFEFRSNNVANWLKIIPKDGSESIRIYNVRAFKALDTSPII